MSEKKLIFLEERDKPHVSTILSIARAIAWADDGSGLGHQVNVDLETLTDLRCALTAIGLGRDWK